MAGKTYQGTERRAHRRDRHRAEQRATLSMTVAGQTYPTVNWSLGGALLQDLDSSLMVGGLVTIDTMALADGTSTAVSVRARVIRADRERAEVAIAFLDVDAPAYGVLERALALKAAAEHPTNE